MASRAEDGESDVNDGGVWSASTAAGTPWRGAWAPCPRWAGVAFEAVLTALLSQAAPPSDAAVPSPVDKRLCAADIATVLQVSCRSFPPSLVPAARVLPYT
jgi:hypothetical protein